MAGAAGSQVRLAGEWVGLAGGGAWPVTNWQSRIDAGAGARVCVFGGFVACHTLHNPLRGEAKMPLYEYECKVCGLRFQRRQHFTDDPVKTCPECRGEVHRLVHPVAIIFKGKGFYVTDNRKASSTTLVPEAKKELETPTMGETTEKSKDVAEPGQ